MQRREHKTWIEINRVAIKKNVRSFRSILSKKTRLYAVVKANAYGHGLELFALEAVRAGVDGFCVDSVHEGIKLRKAGITLPILVLGQILPVLISAAADATLAISVSNFDVLDALRRVHRLPKLHLKFDTGMHRRGFDPKDVQTVLKHIKSSPSIRDAVEGIYTHFAAAKDIVYPTYTEEQFKKFLSIQKTFKRFGFQKIISHAAATGGATLFPRTHLDMVRIGIGLYGYWPSKEAFLQHHMAIGKRLSLQKVLSWKALVGEVKTLRKGEYIGYDLTEYALDDTTVLNIPIGYAQGFPRSLSGVGEVLVKSVRARVMGKVSMDSISVALSKGNRARVGDTVVIIGKNGREQNDADFLGSRAGTLVYEFLTRLSPFIERKIT